MKKYKYSRKEWVMEFSKWLGFDDKFAEFDQDAKDERKWLRDLLATKEPKSDKERCDHDHLCCPGDIKTVRCAYCGKSMYHEPQEELEVEELNLSNWIPSKSISRTKRAANVEIMIENKINQLIKAHNALVKEVRK